MKLEVGDKVVVRPRLQSGKAYGKMMFVDDMEKFRNKEVTIFSVVGDNKYYLIEDSEHYTWTEEMFTDKSIKEAIEKRDKKIIRIENIDELKVGDRIKAREDYPGFNVKKGYTAKVCLFNGSNVLVEFDEYVDGHNGNASEYKGKDGHCWYFDNVDIRRFTKIEEEEIINDDKEIIKGTEQLKLFNELSNNIKSLTNKIDKIDKTTPFEQAMIEAIIEKGKDLAIDDLKSRLKEQLDTYIEETYGCVPKKIVIEDGAIKKELTGIFHKEFDKICKIVKKGIPLMLVGGAGAGKNHTLEQVAKALDLTFYTTNAVNQDFKLTGFIDANGKYHETEFYKAFSKGGMFFLDEIDASCPEALIILNGAIANGYFDFPIGRIECNKDFRVVCAGNTYGTGADMVYVGRNVLDGATLDRFVVLQFDYDDEVEKQLAYDIDLYNFIKDLRRAVNESGLRYIISMRALINSTKMLEIGIDKDTILKTTIVKNMQRDDLNTIVNRLEVRGDWYDSFKRLCD